ncbi:MAG: DUF4157 domain-containing protein [Alphaproteobacteria bacterium]|nr:DUF4157 domain-containing protein [Alphaproteobacteria bacterium]
MRHRQLTDGEIALAKTVFGEAVDYSRVRLYAQRILPPGLQKKHQAVAVGNRISFPRSAYSADFSQESDAQKQSVFIHELVHVWQHQNRVLSTPREAARETLKHKFNYAQSYPYRLDPARDLTSYGFEQQAAMIQDYFLLTQHKTATSFKGRRIDTAAGAELLARYKAVLKNFLHDPRYAARAKPAAPKKPRP